MIPRYQRVVYWCLVLGTLLLSGIILIFDPTSLAGLKGMVPAVLLDPVAARILGAGFVGIAALYIAGSVLRLPPLTVMGLRIFYPRPAITLRQLVAAPLELLGAAGIIHFALPDGGPAFFTVLAVFLASFSAALLSNAPGGLGVFELVFITAMPSVPRSRF